MQDTHLPGHDGDGVAACQRVTNEAVDERAILGAQRDRIDGPPLPEARIR
jgi:hypothetical protein